MGKERDAWAAGSGVGGFVFGSEEQRKKNEETLDRCLRQLHSKQQQPLERERYDVQLLKSNLSDLRTKLYNGANPPDPIRNSWMKDPVVAAASALSEAGGPEPYQLHRPGSSAPKQAWEGASKPHEWVPESREDKKRWLEKVYGANHAPHFHHLTTRAAHVRPTSALWAQRPSSAAPQQRPLTAGASRASAKQGGEGGGGGKRQRPLSACVGGAGKKALRLKEAYRELEEVWGSSFPASSQSQQHTNDAAPRASGRPKAVPRLTLRVPGGMTSDDDDDDVLIEEDDEEGWEDEDWAGDVVDSRHVASPQKPRSALVQGQQQHQHQQHQHQQQQQQREEYSRPARPSSGGSSSSSSSSSAKRVNFTPSMQRPTSAPAMRKPTVIRLSAQGSLGGSSGSSDKAAGRPSSAGATLRIGRPQSAGAGRGEGGMSGVGGEGSLARRRNRGEDVKVFIITGPFQDVRKGLLRRGWEENPNKESETFDLKWALHDSEVAYSSLQTGQIVNHFEGNADLTSKGRLTRTVRNMSWELDQDPRGCLPDSFDVSDPSEWEAFVSAFRDSAVASLLLLYHDRHNNGALPSFQNPKTSLTMRVAIKHAQRRIKQLRHQHGGVPCAQEELCGSDAEDVVSLMSIARERVRQSKKSHSKPAFRNAQTAMRVGILGGKEEVGGGGDAGLDKGVEECLEGLRAHDPQFLLAGEHCVWISKGSNSSKGVGIKLFDKLSSVGDAKGTARVLQKYCEQPCLINRRKFDLRLWVLVTDWNPLTVWVYDDCMVRFCADAFDLGDLSSRTRHLTNVCVNKGLQNQQGGDEDGVWCAEQMDEFLYRETGDVGVWRERVLPDVRRLAVKALECARGGDMKGRTNSFEMYGIDVMLDANLRPWLLEINLSPDMRHTTKLKSLIGPKIIESLLTLTLDLGFETLRKAPVAGMDATSAQQRALMGASLGIPSLPCCRIHGNVEGESCRCVCCGGSGGWCLVHRGEEMLEAGGGGDLSLGVEGCKIDCKAYRQFEGMMEKRRKDLAVRRIQAKAKVWLLTRRLARYRAMSVLLQARLRMAPRRQWLCATKHLAVGCLAGARMIVPRDRAVGATAGATVAALVRRMLAQAEYRRGKAAATLQCVWRGMVGRGVFRARGGAVVTVQSWWRERKGFRFVWGVVSYADWLHDEVIEEVGVGGGGREHMGVPVAWLALEAGDVGGRGRGGGSTEGFRKVCMGAFRGWGRGEGAVRTLQRGIRRFIRERRERKEAAARVITKLMRSIVARNLKRREGAARTLEAVVRRGGVRCRWCDEWGAGRLMARVCRSAVTRRRVWREAEAKERLESCLRGWAGRVQYQGGVVGACVLQGMARAAIVRRRAAGMVLGRWMVGGAARRRYEGGRAGEILGVMVRAAVVREGWSERMRGCLELQAACRRGAVAGVIGGVREAQRVVSGAWRGRVARKRVKEEREKREKSRRVGSLTRESRYRRLVLGIEEDEGGQGRKEKKGVVDRLAKASSFGRLVQESDSVVQQKVRGGGGGLAPVARARPLSANERGTKDESERGTKAVEGWGRGFKGEDAKNKGKDGGDGGSLEAGFASSGSGTGRSEDSGVSATDSAGASDREGASGGSRQPSSRDVSARGASSGASSERSSRVSQLQQSLSMRRLMSGHSTHVRKPIAAKALATLNPSAATLPPKAPTNAPLSSSSLATSPPTVAAPTLGSQPSSSSPPDVSSSSAAPPSTLPLTSLPSASSQVKPKAGSAAKRLGGKEKRRVKGGSGALGSQAGGGDANLGGEKSAEEGLDLWSNMMYQVAKPAVQAGHGGSSSSGGSGGRLRHASGDGSMQGREDGVGKREGSRMVGALDAYGLSMPSTLLDFSEGKGSGKGVSKNKVFGGGAGMQKDNVGSAGGLDKRKLPDDLKGLVPQGSKANPYVMHVMEYREKGGDKTVVAR